MTKPVPVVSIDGELRFLLKETARTLSQIALLTTDDKTRLMLKVIVQKLEHCTQRPP